MSQKCCLALVALAMSMLGGCTGGGSDVGAVKVTGTVTLDGNPVEGATVSFAPKDTATGRVATGLTDASGKFALQTVNPGDGALPGSYDVIISKQSGGMAPGPQTEEQMMAESRKVAESGSYLKPSPEVKNELPAKYSVVGQSGFTADVKEGGDNTFTFDMKSE